jgi:hypothetical protein
LRAALDVFRSHDADVACAQASLCIQNFGESWLTRGIMAQTPEAPASQKAVLFPPSAGRRTGHLRLRALRARL